MNKEMVFSEEVSNKYDVMELQHMIKEHVAFTNYEKAKEILDNFSEYLPKFKKVIPYVYNRMLDVYKRQEHMQITKDQMCLIGDTEYDVIGADQFGIRCIGAVSYTHLDVYKRQG